MGKSSRDEETVQKRDREAGWSGAAGRAIGLLERVYTAIAAVFLFCIMLIIVSDVTLRYVFNSPLRWAFDLISMYLMAGVFFLSLSDTLANNGHVNVDVLYRRAPARARRFMNSVGCVLALLVFAGIAYQGGRGTWESLASGEVLAGNIAWPVWMSRVFVPLGAGLLLLRLLISLFRVWRPSPGREDRGAAPGDDPTRAAKEAS